MLGAHVAPCFLGSLAFRALGALRARSGLARLARVIEVWQAEWCPYSHRVRQRLTELGLPFVARPVAAEREDRDEMREAVGSDEIPVVVLEDGTVLDGDADEIVKELGERFPEGPDAAAHRRKAAEKARGEG